MTEKEQIKLMKFIGEHTIYVKVEGLGFAYSIVDLANFTNDLMKYLKENGYNYPQKEL